MINREEIYQDLQCKVSKKRLLHIVGVEYTAASLAMRYGYSLEKAMIAGLLHDYAKALEDRALITYCLHRRIFISDAEKVAPYLLHGKVGASMAKEEYQVNDDEILSAIAYHTTGRPEMTLLDKIIFVADYIEPSRTIIKNLELIRTEAFVNINNAVEMILKNTIDYLKNKHQLIDQTTIEAYNYYKKENAHG